MCLTTYFHGELKNCILTEFLPVMESVMRSPLIVKNDLDSELVYDFRNPAYQKIGEGYYYLTPLFSDKNGYNIPFYMEVGEGEDEKGFHIIINAYFEGHKDYNEIFHYLMKSFEIYGNCYYELSSNIYDDFYLKCDFDNPEHYKTIFIENAVKFSKRANLYTPDINYYLENTKDTDGFIKKADEKIQMYIENELRRYEEINRSLLKNRFDDDFFSLYQFFPYSSDVYEKYLCTLEYLLFRERNYVGLDYFFSMRLPIIKKYNQTYMEMYCADIKD